MSLPQVVIDTSVIIAGLRSKRGSAFKLLSLIGTEAFDQEKWDTSLALQGDF
jgi:predicted nucleic acid-binding protein